MIVMDSVEDDTVGVKTLNLVDVLSEIKKTEIYNHFLLTLVQPSFSEKVSETKIILHLKF